MSILTKPTELPRWAETTAGTPAANITDPPSGNKDTGWTLDQVPPSSWFNWYMQNVYDWIKYSDSTRLSQILSPWQKRGTANGGGTGSAIAFASTLGVAGRVVVVNGTDTNFYYSDDAGNTWTTVANNGGGAALNNILWNGSLFVACGNAKVVTSPDAVTWTARASGSALSAASSGLAWNGTVWAMGMANGHVATSTDGTTWTSQTTGLGAPTAFTSGIAWGAGPALFVATSNNGSTTTSIATSPDGTTWTLRTAPGNMQGGYGGVGYFPFSTPQFWAFDNSTAPQKLYTSPDGITWTLRISPSGTAYGLIPTNSAYVGGEALIIGSVGRALYSVNGTTWVEKTTPVSTAVTSETTYICNAFNGAIASTGSDGFIHLSPQSL